VCRIKVVVLSSEVAHTARRRVHTGSHNDRFKVSYPVDSEDWVACPTHSRGHSGGKTSWLGARSHTTKLSPEKALGFSRWYTTAVSYRSSALLTTPPSH